MIFGWRKNWQNSGFVAKHFRRNLHFLTNKNDIFGNKILRILTITCGDDAEVYKRFIRSLLTRRICSDRRMFYSCRLSLVRLFHNAQLVCFWRGASETAGKTPYPMTTSLLDRFVVQFWQPCQKSQIAERAFWKSVFTITGSSLTTDWNNLLQISEICKQTWTSTLYVR